MWKMTPEVGGCQQSKLKKMLSECDRRCAATTILTVRMISNELSKNSERVWTIIMEELGMKKICSKMAPRLLTDEQKERRVEVCQDILTRLETDLNLPGRTTTGDESWIFENDSFTKWQILEWKSPTSPRPKKARMSKSKVKVMLISFFDVRGIVRKEFL